MNTYKNYDEARLLFNKGLISFDDLCNTHRKLPKPYNVRQYVRMNITK